MLFAPMQKIIKNLKKLILTQDSLFYSKSSNPVYSHAYSVMKNRTTIFLG